MNALFQMSADARLLYQRLRQVAVGEVARYDDLAAEISRPVHGSLCALRTALRRCQNDNQMVFAPVRGVGVKRLTDAEIVDEATSATAAVRRKARRSAARLMLVNDFDALPEPLKAQHMARASILASVAHLTSERQVDRFISSAGSVKRELPVAETLRMFS